MLSSRLPTVLIARLLLGLLLVCNLTLCISWHGAVAREEAMPPSLSMTSAANLPAAMQGLPCHDGGDGYAAADLNQDECQMHGGLTSPMGAGLPLLAALLTWPRVRPPLAAASALLLQPLSLLFVPVGVGVMAHLDLLQVHGLRLLLVIVVSTWIGLAVTAWVLHRMLRQTKPAHGETESA